MPVTTPVPGHIEPTARHRQTEQQKRVKNQGCGQHHQPGKAEVPLHRYKIGPQGLKEDKAVADGARFWVGKALTRRNRGLLVPWAWERG